MIILENEFLKAAIDPKGAQLSSLIDKATGFEQMWQANPDVWAYHAPNLFPIVGQLNNDELIVDGQKYPMKRHGFARQTDFITVDADDAHASFSLPYSPLTLEVYPYKFDFQVLYMLIDNALRVTYKVINRDDKRVYFSVGGHPAFNVPFNEGEKFEDYYLKFEMQEELHTHLLSAQGTFTGETHPVPTLDKKLHLTADLFAADALVFKNIRSRMVTIKSDKHDRTLSVEFPHFNYLGLWNKPGANFLCIEPWLGCADSASGPTDISAKEAIQKVDVGHVFEASYYISI
ncbi:aldose 1-epimerase family protein [Mucilaginibacter pallidiroseus]|uniref:Aldose 1-epimerase family protein n=1 Tax=Mucilaginibacter pallidiroseus TaxID=2599295 RepID=A0A563U7K5_9SPHI|nr:aldose 1-epimerase family protein [Mucilaginibacter pallidiroseus]TWR27351.1 aldose 1-epimerase family protein [Mucilaginibacter pallidiroseus]